MGKLSVQNLSVYVRDTALVRNISFNLSPGELVIMIGPNGAGKTSALRGSLGMIPTRRGVVRIGSQPLTALSPQMRAQNISYLPQSRPLAWPAKVKDIVALGRFAYGAQIGRLSRVDAQAVTGAMTDCDIAHLSERRADTLSGGEAARMHLARIFAASAPLLLADEPVAALDPRHQFRVMDLIQNYVARGAGALIVLHDLALARRYADRIIALKSGEIFADGPCATTLTAELIAQVYGVKAELHGPPDTGTLTLLGPTQS